MKRSEAMKQYLLENGEQIIADTIFLAQHQSPTIRKEYVEKCADAIQELMRQRLGIEPTAVYPQQERYAFYPALVLYPRKFPINKAL